MAKFIYAVVALLMVVISPVFAADITTMNSFSPVRNFASGTGEGYAKSYVNRDKADFVRILQDPEFAQAHMRVSCETLVAQMMQVHPELGFEGCEGAAYVIQNNPAFEVRDCDAEMFTVRNAVAVTNSDGTAFGAWNRACYTDEKVLTYNGKEIISLMCLNPVIPAAPVRQMARETVTPEPQVWRTARADDAPLHSGSCPMIMDIRIYDSRAAQVSEVSAILAQVDSHGRRQIKGAQEGALDGDGSELDRISRKYGAIFDIMLGQGHVSLSTHPHEVEVVLWREGREVILYDGPIVGERRVSIPDALGFAPGDKVITRFDDYQSIVSPYQMSGIHSWYEEFKQCSTNTQSAIER